MVVQGWQIEGCRAIYNSGMSAPDKLAAIGNTLGFSNSSNATAATPRTTRTTTRGRPRKATTTTATRTRSRGTRSTRASNADLRQLIEAAAQQHIGTFTPAQLIANYPALKNARPTSIAAILRKLPGATKTGRSWSYSAPTQQRAA